MWSERQGPTYRGDLIDGGIAEAGDRDDTCHSVDASTN
jgi:hypothetical protein